MGHPLPPHLSDIVTPVTLEFWERELSSHPDKSFSQLIIRGLKRGFHIGFQKPDAGLKTARSNMISALQHPDIVSDYIAKELSSHHLARVGSPQLAASLHIQTSPLGVIPKKGRTNKWRLIMDLSSPSGHSVNDGIEKELCSFHYASISDAATQLNALGKGALMAKMDIKQAYRNIPVAPEDRHLLGISWDSTVYVDQVLPFGLRSAPLIFSAVADALLWIMQKNGVTYIDDFLTIGGPDSSECLRNMQLMEETCTQAGLPIEQSKSMGPSSSIVFLGIEMDSITGTLSLPIDKLQKIRESLAKWRGFKACRKRDLLSLIGVLSHASKVIRASRIFLRRLIDLSTTARHLDHFIRLNGDARSDLEWWAQFIST